jgi:hypothetical protein
MTHSPLESLRGACEQYDVKRCCIQSLIGTVISVSSDCMHFCVTFISVSAASSADAL